jgi:hypothetical protein
MMPRCPTCNTVLRKAQRWCSVYGATVAAQVRERFSEGKGAPTPEDMLAFVEEAQAVADMAEEAWNELRGG